MIDKNILPDYPIEKEKLRLHAALPLLAPAVATAIGAALGLTGTGLVLQKKIQNYFANNPGALDSITSKFGTKPGDQPEVEEELKELTKPVGGKIETWEGSYADTGTKIPEKIPESKGIEVPPQEKVALPGFQKAEPLGTDILTKDTVDETVPKEAESKKGIKSDKVLTKVEKSVEKSIKKEEIRSLEEEARKFETADEFMYAEKTLPIKLVTSKITRETIISRRGKIESRTPDAPVVVTIEGGKIMIKDGNQRYYQKIDEGAKTIKVVFTPKNDAQLISIWKIAQKKTSEIEGKIAEQAKIFALEKELELLDNKLRRIYPEIKNKIQTWEKYMPQDEAEKAVKEGNITLKDLEIPALKKQITFRKTGDGFIILFDRKEVGELTDITQLKQEANEQEGNTRSYQMSIINEDGSKGEPYDTFDGEKNAKDFAKDDIAKALLRETEDSNYPSLRDIFQNLEYNKKGEPKAVAEELERLQKELAEREKNKKAMGGLIDKSLIGGSRYI